MSASIVTDEITGLGRVEVLCNTCGTSAPPASEILAAHGLMRLGWYCSGGTHICGGCPHPVRTDHKLKVRWMAERGRPDMIFEDRASVVAAWRAEGIICAQVAPGEF